MAEQEFIGMASTKISALTALTGANAADADLFAIVDTDASATKSIAFSELRDGYLLTKLRKVDGTAAPTTTDDSASGYDVGSVWVDTTNDEAYICVDATASAAVWRLISGSTRVLADTTLGGAGNFDESGLTLTRYSRVDIRWAGKQTTNPGNCDIRFNNDSGTNYTAMATERTLVTTGPTYADADSTGASGTGLTSIKLGTTDEVDLTMVEATILYPGSAFDPKVVFSRSWRYDASGNTLYTQWGAGRWESSSAITRIQVQASAGAGTFQSGAQLKIIGYV